MNGRQLAQDLQIPWQTGDGAESSLTVEGLIQGTGIGIGGGDLTIGAIISRATQYIFLFAGIGLFIMLLSGGFTLLTSAGDAKKLEQGKQRLTNGLLGFFIVFASFWLVQAAGIIFGLSSVREIFQ